MLREEPQVELATLRMQLRAVDSEIAAVRRESRRYKQMRFGLDIKEIQLTALQEQRETCVKRIGELQRELHLHPSPRINPLAWLLLPVALWLRVQQALIARPAQPSPTPVADNLRALRREQAALSASR